MDPKRAKVDQNTLMLMRTAEHGFTTEAEGLIKDGADVNGLNIRTEKTPLVLASENGHQETACLLIKYGADIERVEDFYSPLASAAENGHTEIVGMLIAKGANINKMIYSYTSILSLASKNGHNNTVKILIQNGANVNVEEQDPALKWAIRNGHTDVVRTLIEGGANKDYQDYSGCSLLETSIMMCKTDVAKLLIEKGACVDGALRQAFEKKNAAIIKILTTPEIDLNQKDKYGNTFLILAAIGGETDLVIDLIHKGSDIEAQEKRGMTALMCASFSGSLKAVVMLLEKGADVNKKAINGRTALMFASLNGCKDVIEKLIDYGANINETCQNGMTALMYACQDRRTDIVKLLIGKGADLNIQDENGDTALILATKMFKLENMKILIHSGANVSIRGKDGLSARTMAMMKNVKEMLTLFVKNNSVISQDSIQEHQAVSNMMDTETKSPGKCGKTNQMCIKPEQSNKNSSHVISTDIQHNKNIDKKDLHKQNKENLGSTDPVKQGKEGRSLCEHQPNQLIHSSTNKGNKCKRQCRSLNPDKMYSRVASASSQGLNFKRLKLADIHGSKVRDPKFANGNVSKFRRPNETRNHGSKDTSPKDTRSPLSNARCNKWNLGTGPPLGISQTLLIQSAFPCNDSFKRIVTDTTETEFSDITGIEYEDITVGESTDISGTEPTNCSGAESTNSGGTESTSSSGKGSTSYVDKTSPKKTKETLTHTFRMEDGQSVANLLDEFIANLRPKRRTKDVTKDEKIKNVYKTDELSNSSPNITDKKICSCDDLLSFNKGPNINTGQMKGDKNSSDNKKSQIVFKLYHIENVNHAHLQNPSYVNITDATYCVIDEKTPNI
ncbi:unnamed protein product [Lymnaea stagnalis]|uniref:Uncharacterized protein n=1 Tax=Lymnaea stagnalis TaxID=6523 RepID=A0AAV2IS25_LYMST